MMKKNTGVLASLMFVAWIGMAKADFVVEAGWDLFETSFAQLNFLDLNGVGLELFEGVPLGSFDFGGGAENTGNTDTIVERLEVADSGGVPGSDTIAIELVALSLVSVNEIDLGWGDEFWDATVSSDLGSEMTITFDDMSGGTFSSTLNFVAQVTGQTSGQVLEVEKTLVSTDTAWQRSPTGELILDGINYRLNGIDESQDFATGSVIEDAGDGTIHIVDPVPVPATLALFSLGLVGLGWSRRRRA